MNDLPDPNQAAEDQYFFRGFPRFLPRPGAPDAAVVHA